MKKKALYILVVFAAIIVACIFIFKSDPVPDRIIKQFNDDSGVKMDSVTSDGFEDLMDSFNEFEDDSVEVVIDSTEV